MELLIIKSGKRYLRFKGGKCLLVGLDKASVFPMERLSLVTKHEAQARAAGYSEVRLKKLVLKEEDFQP